MNFNDMNCLGQALNVSFGRSSIREKGYGCNYKIMNNTDSTEEELVLELRFETIMNFNPRHGMQEQKKVLDDECVKVLNQCLAEVKREFKELCGKTLKSKKLPDEQPLVEHISHNISLVRARYIKYMKLSISV